MDDGLRSDAIDVHSAGSPGAAHADGPVPRPSQKLSVFASLRFDGVVPLEAEKLRAALAPMGVSLEIINMKGGGDIDTTVFKTIEHCDTFVVFGSAKYGEDTGNQACTFFEYKHAFSLKKRILLIRMIPFEQAYEELQARVIFGANKLVIPWMLGAPMPAGLAYQILDAMELGAPVQAAPEPEPDYARPATPAPAQSGGPWPAELAELMGITAFGDWLTQFGVHSLDDFAESIDLEEGHDAAMHAVLAALPDKPKKARLQRNRAQLALCDLVLRLRLFEELIATRLAPSAGWTAYGFRSRR